MPIDEQMYRPRVLLAEDHAETAERLRKLLRADFDVIASVEDGDALVDAAERLSPDVIVTDIAMPGIDGIEAAVLIRRHDPERPDRVRDGACRIDVRRGGPGGRSAGIRAERLRWRRVDRRDPRRARRNSVRES